MDNEICKRCMWWVSNPEAILKLPEKFGECHRNAPRVVDYDAESIWPQTHEKEFCGEWYERL